MINKVILVTVYSGHLGSKLMSVEQRYQSIYPGLEYMS